MVANMTVRFMYIKSFTFCQLLVAGPEYMTFGDMNILETD